MNRIYKVIWSKVKHQYVVVSELAHSCTKSTSSRVGRSAAAVLAALVLTTGLCAAPVQAEDLTDPYAIVNARVKETNSTSSDTLVALVQSPLAKSVAPLADEGEGQLDEGGATTPEQPDQQPEQHTIYNEEGFYAHNQQNTYNALTKDGLWVGGDDQAVGFHVDNEGNLFTNGTATFKKGADMGGQKITNVADGEVSDASKDAVNGSQLNAVKNAVTELDNLAVKYNEDKTAVNLGAATLTTTSAVNAGSVVVDGVTVDGGKITGLTAGTEDTDAVNVKQMKEADTATLTSATDYADKLDKLNVKYNEDKTVVDLGAATLTTTSAVNAGSVVVDGVTIDGGKITGLTAGTEDADAVNVKQMKEADTATLTSATDYADKLDKLNVKYNEDKTAVDLGAATLTTTSAVNAGSVVVDGVTIDGGKITGLTAGTEDADAVNVKQMKEADTATLTSATDYADKLDKLNVKYNEDKTAVDLGAATLTTTSAVNAGSVVVDGVTVDGGKITGLTAGTEDTDAVTVKQMKEADTATLTSATDYADKLDKLNVKYNEDKTAVDLGAAMLTTTSAVNAGSVVVDGVTVDGGTITGLTAGTEDADAVNVKQMKEADTATLTSATDYADKLDKLNVKYNEDKTAVNLGAATLTTTSAVNAGSVVVDGVTVDGGKITGLTAGTEDTDAVNVKQMKEADTATLTSATDYADKLDKLNVKYNEDKTEVDLSSAALTTTGAISGGSGMFTTSVSVGASGTVIQIGEGKISGLLTDQIANPTDAVNKEYVDALALSGGKTYKNGNGISIDDATNEINVKVNDNNGNLKVDKAGLSLNTELKGLTSVTAGSVVVDGVTVDGGKITGLTAGTEDADAVNVKQMKEADTATLTSATDYADKLDKLNVKYNEDKTAVDLGAATLTTTSAVNAGSVVVDGVMVDGGKITGLTAGTEDADAVNVKQMKDADTATLTSATDYADKLDKLNVKYNEDKTEVDLSSAALTTTGAISGGSGTFTTSVSIGTVGSTIQIGNGKITGLDTDAIADEEDAVNVGFLNKYVNTQKDSAVQYDANTNKASVTLEGIGGTVINNVKAGDWSATSTAAAPVSQVYSKTGSVNWISTNFLNNSQDLTTAVSALDSAIGNNRYTGRGILEVNADHQTYSDVTSAVSTLDQYIGDLTMHSKQAYFSEGQVLTSVTYGLDELSGAIGTLNFNGTSFVKNQGNLTGAVEILDRNLDSALKAVGVFTTTDDEGNVTASTEINWGGKNTFHYISNGTVVDGMSILDNLIYNINTQLGLSATGSIDWGTGVSARLSGSSSIFDGMKNLDTAITGLENRVDALEQQPGTKSASNTNSAISEGTTAEPAAESAPTETTATETPTAATMESAIAKAPAAANSMLSSAQPMTMALNAPAPANGDPAPVGDPTGGDMSNIHTDGDTTIVEKDFTVEGDSTFEGTATFEQGADMNGQKITNVAAGTEATDGVNYGQLQAVQNQVDANTQNIGILGSAVNKLGDRIERVGAGAAALAALHPLDFDPDNKLDFAAGFGNYRGASAVAVGAFYRPSENVMFSVGGAFGGGEDMVNAGVSFKVGAGSGSATTSRTAMAKSLKSMQEVVASQDAQLAQQREQIDKLTAMVELLMEQNGQAQPKDGDTQAGQPQQ